MPITKTNSKLFQKTIQKAGSISGIGLHSGQRTTVHFKPAGIGHGIKIFKKDQEIPKTVLSTSRCTMIGDKDNQLQTVEHLLAALSGLEITNLRVETEASEVPVMDGSALEFVNLLKHLGIEEQSQEVDIFQIFEPIFCSEGGKALAALPDVDFSIAYTLDYPHPLLSGQTVDFKINREAFEKEIAPARTFCTSAESDAIQKQGFGLGANYKNTLVIGEQGPLDNQFRFPDECARHKVLDIMGDLSLLGFPLAARIIGIRSGHTLNQQLVDRIKEQRGKV